MKTIRDIVSALTQQGMLDALTELLHTYDVDFRQEEENCKQAVENLRSVLPGSVLPGVDMYIAASQKMVIGNMLYAAYEGYRVNLENFHAPVTMQFTRMDCTDYIREHLIAQFPTSLEASRICDQFRGALPESCLELEEIVAGYYTALDVMGVKLAHYVGYMLSNEILPWVVPGYRADVHQTLEYQRELRGYLGFLPQ